MGKFLQEVQSGKIAGPRTKTFTRDNWTKEFNAFENPDDADRNLYAAALAVHEKMENIRANLKFSTNQHLSATTKLRACIAGANQNFLLALDEVKRTLLSISEHRSTLASDPIRVDEIVAAKFKLPGGFQWTTDEVAESLADGVELASRFILENSPDLSGNAHMEEVDWDEVALELNQGVNYRNAEELWDDCLWNGYKIFDRGALKFFLPEDLEVKRGHAIGLARSLALSTTFSAQATLRYREGLSRGKIVAVRDLKSIERVGKRQVIKVGKQGENTAALEKITVMRQYADKPYYDELLERPLPAVAGLTLTTLIDAWAIISRASGILLEAAQARHNDGVQRGTPLIKLVPSYAPVLQVGALVDALTAAMGIKPPESKRLIEFFTFRGVRGQEIWAQPLVPVGSDTVAPVFNAASFPNVRRLVDIWMRQAGINLTDRGTAYELYVRSLTHKYINRSKALAGFAASVPVDYTFRPTGKSKYQMDLVFAIGASVFLAESKCILEPTEMKAIAKHLDTVQKAVDQILERVNAVELHREAFIQDMKQFNIDVPSDFRIYPLVIVSTTTHVGVPLNGVPVIDELILGRFLDGGIEEFVMHTREYTVHERMKTSFYSDAVDAEAKAFQYFSSPPQLQRFFDGVCERIVPIHALNDGDWEARVLTLECVPIESSSSSAMAQSMSAEN